IPFKPSLQSAYEMNSADLTVSAAVDPIPGIRMGFLHRFKAPEAEVSDAGVSTPPTPDYSDLLFWLKATRAFSSRWTGSLLLERNLSTESGQYVSPMVEFQARGGFSFFARADILTGEDFSYFGTWRALDSVAFGGRLQW